MDCLILNANSTILLIGAGPVDQETVAAVLPFVGHVVCADGGLRHARRFGVSVDLIIGDLDSAETADFADTRVIQMDDQNTTDFQKCLSRISAPMVIAIGFLGGRLDHQMAAFSALLKTTSRVVLVDDTTCVGIVWKGFRVDVPRDAQVAFYPLVPVVATMAGVKWPVADTTLAPDGVISTSNHALGGAVTAEVDRHGLLFMLPAATLSALIQG